ncbi:MAG: trypsin-like peptidase domain-containing protein [Candidatus Melainabacteria bacterium]|nr:trypsin-like peptidase domain-containing protein [Candidatus Melainabacteria bacterium]
MTRIQGATLEHFRIPQTGRDNNEVFLEPSKRDPESISDLIATKNLTTANLYNPRIKKYFFSKAQIETACPNVALGYDKTARIAEYGSGVLISQDGHILTCAHVIDGIFNKENIANYSPYKLKAGDVAVCPSEKRVVIGNGSSGDLNGARISYIGEYVYGPQWTSKFVPDIAILHVPELKGITPVQFAEQLPIINNDLVLLVGQSKFLQFNQMVSIGNVLLLEREGNFFRSDTECRRGNSGGPLFNLNGELLGIVFQSYEDEHGFSNSIIIGKNLLSEAINKSGIS